MTPAEKARVKKISDANYKRMKIGRARRQGKLPTEFTHKQIEDATTKFLNSGGKIEKCYAVSKSSFNTGQPEVDTFLMGV